MSNAQTNPQPAEVPPSRLEAAYRLGWLMAGEAIRHVEDIGILPRKEKRRKRPVPVAPEILMELAAVLRLHSWQEGAWSQPFQDELTSACSILETPWPNLPPTRTL
jgi:hypothetical protein